jgi:hypothetical protein
MRSYQDVGLPVFPGAEWVFCGLQYSDAARTLVATLRPSEMARVARVYVRTSDEERYREVLPDVPADAICNVVVCDAAPLAFFAVEDGNRDLVLYKAGLPVSRLEVLPAPRLHGSHARFWLAGLHAATSDGTSALVRIGVQPQAAADGAYHVSYALARMATSTGVLSIVAELPAVFA